MHKILSSILLIAVSFQIFNQGWYCLSYLIQKNEYIKQCVNKARPEMDCNGKCLLMKKIQEHEQKEHGQPPELKLAAKLETLSSRSFFSMHLHAPVSGIAQTFLPHKLGSPIDRSYGFFHPPDPAV